MQKKIFLKIFFIIAPAKAIIFIRTRPKSFLKQGIAIHQPFIAI